MTLDQAKYRADLIDGIVNTALVAVSNRERKTELDKNATFSRFDLRVAVAMAVGLALEPNEELVEMMNKVVVG